MIGFGVAGFGYWGPNLVRNLSEVDDTRLVAISDLRDERLAVARARYPHVATTRDFRDLLTDSRIDAIAIATPISTHFELALAALRAGKHVMVEKPLAATLSEAVQLTETAEKSRLVLMVDHTFVYTAAVRKIKELIAANVLGQVYYYDSVRVNLGLFQHDSNVIWDLAVHDLAILDYILPGRPRAVSATGTSHIPGGPANIAYLTLFYPGELLAHMHVNWLAPVKVRQTLIGGNRKMILWDDMQTSEKIKIYDRGVEVSDDSESLYKMRIGYRVGDMWAPQLDVTEALRTETLHFVDCIRRPQSPLTDGRAGARVVKLLEAATESMLAQGRPIELDEGPY